MTSEDVIHDFFVPAFRVKADVVPGRYTHALVRADEAGHVSPVLRRVLRHAALGHDRQGRRDGAERLPGVAERRRGRRLAGVGGRRSCSATSACNTCHRPDAQGRGPVARQGSSARPSTLADGETVVADEAYIRESILNPQAKVVAGFQPIMPTFQGQVSEEQLLELIAYIKSLQAPARRRRARRRQPWPGTDGLHAPPSAQHYLNDGYGIKSWLLTTRPQADRAPVPRLDHVLLLHRRRVRGADPPRADDAGRRPASPTRPTTSCSRCTA